MNRLEFSDPVLFGAPLSGGFAVFLGAVLSSAKTPRNSLLSAIGIALAWALIALFVGAVIAVNVYGT